MRHWGSTRGYFSTRDQCRSDSKYSVWVWVSTDGFGETKSEHPAKYGEVKVKRDRKISRCGGGGGRSKKKEKTKQKITGKPVNDKSWNKDTATIFQVHTDSGDFAIEMKDELGTTTRKNHSVLDSIQKLTHSPEVCARYGLAAANTVPWSTFRYSTTQLWFDPPSPTAPVLHGMTQSVLEVYVQTTYKVCCWSHREWKHL